MYSVPLLSTGHGTCTSYYTVHSCAECSAGIGPYCVRWRMQLRSTGSNQIPQIRWVAIGPSDHRSSPIRRITRFTEHTLHIGTGVASTGPVRSCSLSHSLARRVWCGLSSLLPKSPPTCDLRWRLASHLAPSNFPT